MRGRTSRMIGLGVVGTIAAFVTVWFNFGKNPEKAAAIRESERRHFSAALEHWNRYLADSPDDDEARRSAARCARLQGDFPAAISILNKCRPTSDVRLEQRLIAIQQGNLQELLTTFPLYAENNDSPNVPFVMEAVALGSLRVMNPRPGSNAITKFGESPLPPVGLQAANRWLELRPGREDQAAGLTWRARFHDMAADQASAMADFRRALELDPDSFETRLYWTFSSRIESSPKETLAQLLLLQQQKPDDDNVLLGLVSEYRRLGEPAEAIRLLDDLLKREPDGTGLLLERGNLAIDRGDAAEAEVYLERARKLAPSSPEVYFALSRCMTLAGQPAKAQEFQTKFLELEAEKQRNRPSPN